MRCRRSKASSIVDTKSVTDVIHHLSHSHNKFHSKLCYGFSSVKFFEIQTLITDYEIARFIINALECIALC